MAKKISKEELIELSKKLNMNQNAVQNNFKVDAEAAEKQIIKAARFMGHIKK